MPRNKDTAVLSKKTNTSWRRHRKTRQSKTRGLKPRLITSIRLRGIPSRRRTTNWCHQTFDKTAERAPSCTDHLHNYTKGSEFTLPSPTTSCKITKLIRNQQVMWLKTKPKWRWSCQLPQWKRLKDLRGRKSHKRPNFTKARLWRCWRSIMRYDRWLPDQTYSEYRVQTASSILPRATPALTRRKLRWQSGQAKELPRQTRTSSTINILTSLTLSIRLMFRSICATTSSRPGLIQVLGQAAKGPHPCGPKVTGCI